MKMAAHLSLAFKVALQFQKYNEERERFTKFCQQRLAIWPTGAAQMICVRFYSVKSGAGVASGSMVTR